MHTLLYLWTMTKAKKKTNTNTRKYMICEAQGIGEDCANTLRIKNKHKHKKVYKYTDKVEERHKHKKYRKTMTTQDM